MNEFLRVMGIFFLLVLSGAAAVFIVHFVIWMYDIKYQAASTSLAIKDYNNRLNNLELNIKNLEEMLLDKESGGRDEST